MRCGRRHDSGKMAQISALARSRRRSQPYRRSVRSICAVHNKSFILTLSNIRVQGNKAQGLGRGPV